MFLIFVRIYRISLFFLDCPPRILSSFVWRLQKEPLISNSKIPILVYLPCFHKKGYVNCTRIAATLNFGWLRKYCFWLSAQPVLGLTHIGNSLFAFDIFSNICMLNNLPILSHKEELNLFFFLTSNYMYD